MLRLENIKIREDLTKNDIVMYACKKYKINFFDVCNYSIFKKSIDARNKDDIFFNYTIDVNVKNEKKYPKIKKVDKEVCDIKVQVKRKSGFRPVIIGAGPAGLFAGLVLVNNGVKPIIIEQGKCVEDRKKDVDEFINGGKLNVRSNIQFGEGGAGTFSDGKLTSGIHSIYCRNVLEEFVRFGAPEQIKYVNKPHIGTDNLIKIISNMRNYIIEKGGEFLFEEKVIDFWFEDNKIKKVITDKREIQTDTAILAIGHSARDTFEVLYSKNLKMERKNFSVGVRIEHKQSMINESQYGNKSKLKCALAVMFFFVGSAVLVNVTPNDFEGDNPLAGLEFQKELEKKAFVLGGSNYYAPIQRVEDFFENRKTEKIGSIKPTYKPGVTFANLNAILPSFVSNTLKEGIKYFDTKIKGFADSDAIMTGVETRSSSPVRIVRDDSLQSETVKGLYPCGEGPGYAGGIMSAGVDGIKCAIAVLEHE